MISRKLRYNTHLFFRHDLSAGLTVFFVALPLCLGIAFASGAPLYSGIMAGIIGGLMVSLLSGSALSVSGPAAGLTTVVAAALLHYNNYPVFLAIVVMAGVIQILLGVFRLGGIAGYFPSAVIKGMLAAIGIILISKQLPVAMGYNHPDFWSKEFVNLISDTHLFTNLRQFYSSLSLGALIITILSLAAYYLWEQPYFDKMRFIPVPLFVVALGILLNLAFKQLAPLFYLSGHQLVQLPGNMFASLQHPDFGPVLHDFTALKYAVVIALLATLETLLSVEAVDKLDPWRRTTPTNRELVAQGIGNMACGMLGALPMTAVIVRSSANIDAGARRRWSAFVHGFLLLFAVLLVPSIINLIPLCSLAAILVVTGFKLTQPKLFRSMFKLGLSQLLPFLITIVVILFTDLLIGVSIGLLLSVFFIVRNNYMADYDIKQETYQGITTYTLHLHTNVTFLDKSKIKGALNTIPQYSKLIVDGSSSR
ncbi:MAG TPA: SulP family inorganic anion transporter, partial [Chitinophagales bacterium]|nr:SulP family inorganic anion transporter [Chitinophagales bacterium]